MSKIVIIGNSAAGFSASKALVENTSGHEITVISQEDCLPYNKSLFFEFLAGSVKEQDLFLCPGDFYSKNNINFIKGVTVSRIETQKKRLALKDNTRINYDYLIIASGRKINLPDIPGKAKDGVFTVYNLEQFKAVKEHLMIVNAVCIVGGAQVALRFYEAIPQKDKHIKIISSLRPENYDFNERTEWIDNASLSEIIGDGAELKAYKLSNAKAIEASLILFVGSYLPCTEFLKDSGIRIVDDYIVVNELTQTNLENIFACGSVCSKEGSAGQEKSWVEACNEGISAAKNLISSLERGTPLCQPIS